MVCVVALLFVACVLVASHRACVKRINEIQKLLNPPKNCDPHGLYPNEGVELLNLGWDGKEDVRAFQRRLLNKLHAKGTK